MRPTSQLVQEFKYYNSQNADSPADIATYFMISKESCGVWCIVLRILRGKFLSFDKQKVSLLFSLFCSTVARSPCSLCVRFLIVVLLSYWTNSAFTEPRLHTVPCISHHEQSMSSHLHSISVDASMLSIYPAICRAVEQCADQMVYLVLVMPIPSRL